MTAEHILSRVTAGAPVAGRHVLVVAHPDDEVISCSGALCCLADVTIVQLTEDTPAREAERAAAQVAGGWKVPVIFGGMHFRMAHLEAARLRSLVAEVIAGADVIWTHPYEGGHLDHDTAAWIVQSVAGSILRLEFASYHMGAGKAHVFGDFWPDVEHQAAAVRLSGERLDRKLAAIEAYASQAGILRKFRQPDREAYRVAPYYDFSRPAPPPRARWDVKGYQPSTIDWRRMIAQAEAA
jgi:LmbE family N-acetylglucosaminyl deacetylase